MNIQNNYKKEEIVWRDKRIIDNIFLVSSMCFTILFIYLFIYDIEGLFEKFGGIMAILIGITAVYSLLIRKLTIISPSGIHIGNISLKKINSLRLRKRIFLNFKEIFSLKFVNHVVKVPKGSWIMTFIVIKTKLGKKYECVVNDYKGFIVTLKKLNKYDLLAKDSRYK